MLLLYFSFFLLGISFVYLLSGVAPVSHFFQWIYYLYKNNNNNNNNIFLSIHHCDLNLFMRQCTSLCMSQLAWLYSLDLTVIWFFNPSSTLRHLVVQVGRPLLKLVIIVMMFDLSLWYLCLNLASYAPTGWHGQYSKEEGWGKGNIFWFYSFVSCSFHGLQQIINLILIYMIRHSRSLGPRHRKVPLVVLGWRKVGRNEGFRPQ